MVIELITFLKEKNVLQMQEINVREGQQFSEPFKIDESV